MRIRAAHGELYQRIERHNAQHVRPAEYDQVVVYAGQHVLSTHATEASEVKS